MHIGREENNTNYVMTPNNEEVPIKKVSSEKDLGLVIVNKLLFREHISGKVKIANKILGLIFCTFTYMDKGMFLDLYKTLVCLHLEYATPVSGIFLGRISAPIPKSKMRCFPKSEIKIPKLLLLFFFLTFIQSPHTHTCGNTLLPLHHCILFLLLFNCNR